MTRPVAGRRRFVALRLFAAGAALGLDRLLREPPDRLHPVAWFGTAMTALEHRVYADRRANGVVHVMVGVAAGAGAGAALARLLPHPLGTLVATEVAVGGHMLGEVADGIGGALTGGDLEAARAALPALVGREAGRLDEGGIARAAVESVAENTVDAVVAPAFWAALLGAPGVLAHRAINTMDAMVGHRSPRYERFGWAAARLDDVVNWVPARLTALLVVLVRPRAASAVWRAVRRDAPRHPSPNGGVVEAAFAAALDVRLGGANRYGDRLEDRGVLHGEGRAASGPDVRAATRLSRHVSLAAAALLVVGAGAAASGGRRGPCG